MTLLADLLEALEAIERLPEDVGASAANHMLDIVGVAAAAAGTGAGVSWMRYAGRVGGANGSASIIGAGRQADPAEAALVNGGLMHSLEYDDTHTGAVAHGSAVLAATALAVGEAEHRSGRDILHAYAIWYEVLIRLGLSAAGGFQNRGFQLTSVGGALCAAGIAASLKSLDREGCAMAVGIALSQASGVFAFLSNGATVKSMHPGWAAHSGIKAAELAHAGVTGPDRPFEDRFGLFRVFAGDEQGAERFSEHLGDFGRNWHLPDVAFKFLPCCHYIHPFVEAAQKLSADGLRAEEISAMRFYVPEGAAAIICEPWEEKCRAQGHPARWSVPVATAMQLVDGKVALESFEAAASDGVHALAARSSWEPLTDSRFPGKFDAALELTLASGEIRSLRIDDVYGNASRPPSEQAVREKFQSNTASLMDSEMSDELADALRGMAGLSNLDAISRPLRSISPKEAHS